MQGGSKLEENGLAEIDKMAIANEKAPNFEIKQHHKKQHHKVDNWPICTRCQVEKAKLPPAFVTHSITK
jgi:hypothetical protein